LEEVLGLVAREPVAGAHGHAFDAIDRSGGGLVEQTAFGALVGQGANRADALRCWSTARASAFEHDAIALDKGPRQRDRAAALSVPGRELAQAAVAVARDVRVQAIGDDGDQRVGG